MKFGAMRASACLIMLGIAGCRDAPQSPPAQEPAVPDPGPVFIVWRLPGMPTPDEMGFAGLVLATWSDGRVVRLACEGSQPAYQTGRLADDDLARLRDQLAALPQKMGHRNSVVVDAPSEHVYVRLQTERHRFAFTPGVHTPARDYVGVREFVRTVPLLDAKTAEQSEWPELRDIVTSH